MKFRSHHNLFAMRLLATHALFTAAFLMCMTFVSTNAVAQEHKDDDHAKAHAHDDDHAHEDGHDHKDDDHHTEKAGHGDGKHGEGDHGDGHHGDDHHGAPHIWEDSAFWSIIAFAGFCFAIVKLGLWKSLHVNMAAREQKENDLIATAEGHLAEANASLNEYRGQLEAMDETVAETIAEAGRDADHTKTEIVELANREAEQMRQRAEHEIERSRDQSLNSLFEHLAHRVAEAAEAKVRADLQAEDQDRLIDDTLNQLAANS